MKKRTKIWERYSSFLVQSNWKSKNKKIYMEVIIKNCNLARVDILVNAEIVTRYNFSDRKFCKYIETPLLQSIKIVLRYISLTGNDPRWE